MVPFTGNGRGLRSSGQTAIRGWNLPSPLWGPRGEETPTHSCLGPLFCLVAECRRRCYPCRSEDQAHPHIGRPIPPPHEVAISNGNLARVPRPSPIAQEARTNMPRERWEQDACSPRVASPGPVAFTFRALPGRGHGGFVGPTVPSPGFERWGETNEAPLDCHVVYSSRSGRVAEGTLLEYGLGFARRYWEAKVGERD